MRVLAILAGLLLAQPLMAAHLPALIEPVLRLPAAAHGVTRVALTFDACDGRVDRRILDVLEQDSIPATIFVTARWLRGNPVAFAEMRARPDLFEIEDHGARHVPAVSYPTEIYGLSSAGSPAAVIAEASGGAKAIVAMGGVAPHWFRGAAAKYDATAMAAVRGLGFEIAGYSLNGDQGASLSAEAAARRVRGAVDGDVILAHINQPDRPAGKGVAEGVADLRARGVTFVRLEDVLNSPTDKRR